MGQTNDAAPRRGVRRWLALVGLVAVGVAAARCETPASAGPGPGPSPAAAARPLLVDVVVATKEPFAPTVTASGELLPAEQVDIVSELSQRLVKLHADEGAEVKEGDVLFEVDGSELVAQLGRLRAERALAVRDLARREPHADSGAITAREIDVSRTAVAVLDAQLREVHTQLDKTRLRAPFSGVLGIRRVSEGAWLTPSVVIVTLYDTHRFKIDFTLPERYAALVAPGTRFSFTVAGQPARYEATVAVVEPSVERGSRSLRVRGITPAAEGLVAGAFANVTLALEPREALLVPTIAVQASPSGHTVWVVDDGKAALRPVTIGERTPERMEIQSGLAPGDRVISSNLLRLRPGAAIEVRTPAPLGSGDP